jgi:dTDP-4-dehydrorhamnose 3,5-epimerase
MDIESTAIPGVRIIRARKSGDARGFFSETFKQHVLELHGIAESWIQDNHSFSTARGVIRGLHFQAAPAAQAKLVRVTRGAVFDVAVDIRVGSPTYGRHVAVELSAETWNQLYVPVGFAHGFCTLTDETEVLYKVTAPYAPETEGGVLWNDPALGIDWPVDTANATVIARDTGWPRLAELQSPFVASEL